MLIVISSKIAERLYDLRKGGKLILRADVADCMLKLYDLARAAGSTLSEMLLSGTYTVNHVLDDPIIRGK